MATLVVGTAALGIAAGCRARRSPPAAALADGPPAPSCEAPRRELVPGLTFERARAQDLGCLALARIDPRRFRLVVHTAALDGGDRPVPSWAERFGLVAVINASMFREDHRSIGMLVSAAGENNAGDNARLGGFLFFDPVDPADAPVELTGRTCPGFDLAALRRRYRGVVQNYRMLECDGSPIPWADPKATTAAVLALDADGWVVLALSPSLLRMSDLTRVLAAPALRLRQAVYLEGGPEASLFIKAGREEIAEVGVGGVFWAIPNVIGFVPR